MNCSDRKPVAAQNHYKNPFSVISVMTLPWLNYSLFPAASMIPRSSCAAFVVRMTPLPHSTFLPEEQTPAT